MTLGQEIEARKNRAKPCCAKELGIVLKMLSDRGRIAGMSRENKSRGDSAYYSAMAKKRWKK